MCFHFQVRAGLPSLWLEQSRDIELQLVLQNGALVSAA
jgi:hypothetical protein